jgi:hypothetical protein
MNIVAVICYGPYKDLENLTHPSIKAYADKIGATFVNLSETNLNDYDYERIIILHSDILIRPDTPSLFDVVPKGWIGVYNTNIPLKDLSGYAASSKLPEPKPWGNRWYSNGVIVVDRSILENSGTEWAFHYPLLTWIDPKIHYEYTELNFNYYLNQYADHDLILDIGPRFNRMPYFEELSNHYSRFEFYIIHYSQLKSQMGMDNLISLIKEDLAVWEFLKDKNYHFPRNIVAHVGGGLGDQVCAEPVIRELRRLYPYDKLLIENHWPELWKDLKGYKIDGIIDPNVPVEYPPETLHFKTYGNPDTTIAEMGMTHSNMSSMDLTSYLMINRPLPPEKRGIRIGYSEEETNSMLSALDTTKEWLESAVILHPGLTWPTRTISSETWQTLTRLLLGDPRYNHVVIIGQGGPYKGPRIEKIGILDFEIPNVLDARNKLTVKETLSLLDHSHILISNDSAPIHLAGATNIWILGIFTTKHPYFVLPFRKRNNTPFWNAQNISNEPPCWPCGVDAIKSFPEGLRVDLCKNYNDPYCCHPTALQIYKRLIAWVEN